MNFGLTHEEESYLSRSLTIDSSVVKRFYDFHFSTLNWMKDQRPSIVEIFIFFQKNDIPFNDRNANMFSVFINRYWKLEFMICRLTEGEILRFVNNSY